jgi:hypothetical protein
MAVLEEFLPRLDRELRLRMVFRSDFRPALQLLPRKAIEMKTITKVVTIRLMAG